MIRLLPDFVKKIEEILNSGKTVEIAIRNGKIILWAVDSKKKSEQPIA